MGRLTPEEAMWVYTDWPEQETVITGHDLCSFADDLDAPRGLDCGAETASECLFPQHAPVIIDGICQQEGCDRHQSRWPIMRVKFSCREIVREPVYC